MAVTKKVSAKKTKTSVEVVNGEVKERGVVIQNISIRPVQRTMLDIEKWRNYHQAAEGINGTRTMLYDMYNDVLLDGFVKRLVAKRVLGVTKNKLKYVGADNSEIEAADAVLKLRQFRKLRQRIQLYKAWGISVIELMNDGGQLQVFDVPKKHIQPKEGLIVFEQHGTDGIKYKEFPYSNTVVEIGEHDDFGYLLEACAYVIYKRGNIADWANFAQIFGMPFREARYDGYNEGVRIQLESALEKAGSAAYAVLPKEAELTFHEAKGTAGSNDLYNSLRQAMNEELSVLILGATETTTSSASSGYAQSETHLKTVEELAQDDKEDELAILNEYVLPVLIRLGLLPAGGSFVYDEPVNIEVASKKVDVAIKLKNAGVPVSDDYFYEISGIPKPDDYEQLKQAFEDAKIQSRAAATDEEQAAKKDSKLPSKKKEEKKLSVEEQVKKSLDDFFVNALNG